MGPGPEPGPEPGLGRDTHLGTGLGARPGSGAGPRLGAGAGAGARVTERTTRMPRMDRTPAATIIATKIAKPRCSRHRPLLSWARWRHESMSMSGVSTYLGFGVVARVQGLGLVQGWPGLTPILILTALD